MNFESPKISIITAVKNGASFIERCIQNVISQNCPNVEHIIVDGYSTDGSLEIIRRYASEYRHIKYLSEPDRGQSDAMNKGVAMAKGQILGFLNVDDFYQPDLLSRIVKIFENIKKPALVLGNCNVIDHDGVLIYLNKPGKLNLTDVLLGKFPHNPSAYFFHASLQRKVGLYLIDEHYGMDLDFLIRAVQLANVYYFDETFGNFTLHRESKTYRAFQDGSNERTLKRVIEPHLRNLSFGKRLIIYKEKPLLKFFNCLAKTKGVVSKIIWPLKEREKVKILIFSAIGGNWGGSEELWFDMVKVGSAKGYEFLISHAEELKPPLERISESTKSSIRLISRKEILSQNKKSILPVFSKAFLRGIEKIEEIKHFFLLRKFNPDVVLFNLSDSYMHIWNRQIRKYITAINRPYVMLVQLSSPYVGLSSGVREEAIKTFRCAAKLVFVSQQNRSDIERGLATGFSNAVLIKNPIGFEIKDFRPQEFPEICKYRFASVARLDAAHKGQDILLETLGQPIWRDRNWELNLYGSGPDLEYLKELSKFFSVEDRVNFKGFARDVREIWKENHLLLLASRKEGLPIVLLEASVCARPAVVTDVGGNAEWIKDEETGFVAAASTKNSFSETLERAWRRRDEWREMGLRAYQYACTQVDQNPGEDLLRVLASACKEMR